MTEHWLLNILPGKELRALFHQAVPLVRLLLAFGTACSGFFNWQLTPDRTTNKEYLK